MSSYAYGNFIVERNCDNMVSELIEKLESRSLLTSDVRDVVQSMYSPSMKKKIDTVGNMKKSTSFETQNSLLKRAISKKIFIEKQNVVIEEEFFPHSI
uniref:Uncharacterized protein n=1 Tax=Pyramimonas orientalis virus TaxID=455367 RepID=A0A7M3UP52_POV01|nr:hypothetical protein HWQ62_00380 [Pyramimonas orientalis virus]